MRMIRIRIGLGCAMELGWLVFVGLLMVSLLMYVYALESLLSLYALPL
jgi:hypothetical protein